MTEKRKLLNEIDKCFKKVDEGFEVFDEIMAKMTEANSDNQREKFQDELKKEIKKLQRLRDQIKVWHNSSDIKDKDSLASYRKLIETRMESFKEIEKENKTKPYSKQGLSTEDGLDPKEKEKIDAIDWLNCQIRTINDEIDRTESKIEKISTEFKTTGRRRGNKDENEAEEELKTHLDRIKFHLLNWEVLMRLFTNDKVEIKETMDKLREPIETYIEALDPENEIDIQGLDPEDIYEELDLASYIPQLAVQASVTVEEELKPIDLPVPVPKPIVSVIVPSAQANVSKSPSVSQNVHPTNTSSPVYIHVANRNSKNEIATPSPWKPAPTITSHLESKKEVSHAEKTLDVVLSDFPPISASIESKAQATDLRAELSASNAYQVDLIHSSNKVSPCNTSYDPQVPPPLAVSPSSHPNREVKQWPSEFKKGFLNAPKLQPEFANNEDDFQLTGLDSEVFHPTGYNIFGNRDSISNTEAQSYCPQAPYRSPVNRDQAQSIILKEPFGSLWSGGSSLHPEPMTDEMKDQLNMLDSALAHLDPAEIDSELTRSFLPKNRCETPFYYPQAPHPESGTLEYYLKLSPETLFFNFYYMEGTKAQMLASQALKKQSWRFHTKLLMWFQRVEQPKTITDDFEQGSYLYFDFEKWSQRKKENFTFEYKFLEDKEGFNQ